MSRVNRPQRRGEGRAAKRSAREKATTSRRSGKPDGRPKAEDAGRVFALTRPSLAVTYHYKDPEGLEDMIHAGHKDLWLSRNNDDHCRANDNLQQWPGNLMRN